MDNPEMPVAEAPMPASIEAAVEALGGAKVGDTITLQVESIDAETGMATLVTSTPAAKPNSIDAAAMEIDKELES